MCNRQKYRIILAFGSNIGDRHANLADGLNYLKSNDKTLTILAQSLSVYNKPFYIQETSKETIFLNCICDIATNIHPYRFYQDIIVPIENKLGHPRETKWADRALDIDILLGALNTHLNFYDCTPLLIDSESFFLPHKRLLDSERKILQDLLLETLDLTHEHIQCHFTPNLSEKN